MVGACVLVLGLLGGLAFVTVRAQRESRQQLEERFELRNALGASFTSSYVRSVLSAERRRAQSLLDGERVSAQQFWRAVDALNFEAALLLDERGRVLRVWPSKPEILGTQVGARYAHLRAALRGEVGVSDVVLSAAEAKPVVAFAVPFEGSGGRRVFSGAFAIGDTPLAAYLKTALPFAGGELSLVDARGLLVIHNRPGAGSPIALEAADPALVTGMGEQTRGDYRRAGEVRFFSRHAVAGTPWELVVSVPKAQLLAPIGEFKALLPWLLFAAFAIAALSTALLLWRLADRRARLKTANRRLARSNQELRDLDRLKDEFVALVSHELRTPLTSIIGYISALQRGRAGVLPDEQRRLLDVAERNAQRLLRLVGDLLLAAKVDAGKLELEPELLELGTLARAAVETARPHADEREIGLSFTSSGVSLVFADRARLAQVLDNLISNAVKFTPAGGTVNVLLTVGTSRATIEVRDTGIGIPLGEQEQLFRRFFRASTATSREIQGTGLGLSIVKTIVELHQGTIECRSAEGVGTSFLVSFPLAAAEEAAA